MHMLRALYWWVISHVGSGVAHTMVDIVFCNFCMLLHWEINTGATRFRKVVIQQQENEILENSSGLSSCQIALKQLPALKMKSNALLHTAWFIVVNLKRTSVKLRHTTRLDLSNSLGVVAQTQLTVSKHKKFWVREGSRYKPKLQQDASLYNLNLRKCLELG